MSAATTASPIIPGSPDDPYLPMGRAVQYSGYHAQTLRGLVASGRLKAYRLAGGRDLRFRQSDLDGLFETLVDNG